MDKFELAQREVEKKTEELYELEDRHRAKVKEFEDRNNYFQTAYKALQNLFDEKYEETLHYLRNSDADQDFYAILNREIESYQTVSEEALRQARRDLEAEALEENTFKKKRRQLDDELEEAYRRRRLADEES